MRLLLTLVLAALAIVLGAVAGVQFSEGGLSRLLGAPPKEKGDLLHDFNALETARVTITRPGQPDLVLLRPPGGLWQVLSPWKDRADPRLTGHLLAYAHQLTVESAVPLSGIDHDLSTYGLGKDAPAVTLADASGQTQAAFRLGKKAAWEILQEADPGDESNPTRKPRFLPTTYVIPAGGKKPAHHLYLCAQDPGPLLASGAVRLRDHRPLLLSSKLPLPGVLDPRFLTRVEITDSARPAGKTTLARPDLASPFSITTPAPLRTDPKALSALLTRLSRLTATCLEDAPPPESPRKITLTLQTEKAPPSPSPSTFPPNHRITKSPIHRPPSPLPSPTAPASSSTSIPPASAISPSPPPSSATPPSPGSTPAASAPPSAASASSPGATPSRSSASLKTATPKATAG